jgi:hypothetical protein
MRSEIAIEEHFAIEVADGESPEQTVLGVRAALQAGPLGGHYFPSIENNAKHLPARLDSTRASV